MGKGNWREFENPSITARPSFSSNNEDKSNRRLRVQKTKSGRKGKTVTLISGLPLEVDEVKLLLKKLKSQCGTGGTCKEGSIELQGDQVIRVLEFFKTKSDI
tara:strand:+ start:138 stop:443 length:306 start_codon:yes stop_codon:yes gene_type:complete